MLHCKHIYVIVVPHIYVVQNIPHHAHVFFFGLLYIWTHVITHTQYPSSQCHSGIIQVLRLGIMIMFEPCHHRETTSHSQPSTRGCMTAAIHLFRVYKRHVR